MSRPPLILTAPPGELVVPPGGFLVETERGAIQVRAARVPDSAPGREEPSAVRCACTESVLSRLLRREVCLADEVAHGRLVFQGPPDSYFHLMAFFKWWQNSQTARAIFEDERIAPSPDWVIPFTPDAHCAAIANLLRCSTLTGRDVASEVDRRLDSLLRVTMATSSVYRALVGPSAANRREPWGASDLATVPKLGKADLLAINEELHLEEREGHIRLHTSGTTGPRCFVYRTPVDYWMGFYRYLIPLHAQRYEALPSIYFPNPGLKVCDIFRDSGLIHMADASLCAAEHVQNVTRSGATVIYSFPLFLQKILDELEREGRRMDLVRHVVTVGDFLDRSTRNRCARLFPNASFMTTYGSTETGLMAYECREAGQYHVLTPDFEIMVETSAGVRAEGKGRLLVTKLCAGGTPLINYDVGDEVVVRRGVCQCGDKRPSFEYLGRSSATVPLESGVVLNAALMSEVMGNVPSARQFVSNWSRSLKALNILAVPTGELSGDAHALVAEHLGLAPAQVSFQWVDALAEAHGAKRAIFSITS